MGTFEDRSWELTSRYPESDGKLESNPTDIDVAMLVKRLYDRRGIKYDEMDPDVRDFNTLIDIYRRRGWEDDFDELVHLLDELPRPTVLEENTIGSYLYDCAQTDHGDVNNNCAPACINGFNRRFRPSRCPFQTWWINKGHLTPRIVREQNSQTIQATTAIYNMNQRASLMASPEIQIAPDEFFESMERRSDYQPSRAMIFISPEFEGFTTENIDLLRHNHVTAISILMKRDNRYVRLLPFTPIDQLSSALFVDEYEPKTSTDDLAPSIVHITDDEHPIAPSTNNCWTMIIIAIIVIICVVIIYIYLYFNTSGIGSIPSHAGHNNP